MGKAFLLFALIYTSLLFGQNDLLIHFNDSRRENRVEDNFIEFSLYKNDSLYGKYTSLYVHGLMKGNYHIEYNTYFGKRISKSQYIDENSFLPLFEIYVDSMVVDVRSATKNLYIDNLQDKDTLPIYRNCPSCYTHSNRLDSIFIIKEKQNYSVLYNNKRYKLSSRKIAALREFEIQLRNLKRNYYSSSECYTWIGWDDNKIWFSSPVGYWEGYEYLLIELGFLKKKNSLFFGNRRKQKKASPME